MEGKVCGREGCGKGSTLQCPTCSKLGLPPSYFCSQDCFKQVWGVHKNVHTQPAQKAVRDEFAGFQFTGSLRPGQVSPKRLVPDHIPKTDYADDPEGVPQSERVLFGNNTIHVHTEEEIQKSRKVCRLARDVLDMAGKMAAPGVTTDEIDKACHEMIIANGAYPSPLNYKAFPKSICTSINEAICHGIPDDRPLIEGDIVNVDISVFLDGFHGDVNDTFFVGKVSPNAEKLVQVTYECLDLAIKACHPKLLYREVGGIISKHAHNAGFQVVKTFAGHGVGISLHSSPNVPHYAKNKAVGVMAPGHIFTIEPMINEGVWKDIFWPDGWTATTRDGKLSAQFEHTILITETGYEILTARTENSYPYPWLQADSQVKQDEAKVPEPSQTGTKKNRNKKNRRK